jgi:hypothetical protein
MYSNLIQIKYYIENLTKLKKIFLWKNLVVMLYHTNRDNVSDKKSAFFFLVPLTSEIGICEIKF